MPINFTVQTQGRNKGKRAPNAQGKLNPPLNVWAANLPRCTAPRCRNLAASCCADRCWTCSAKTHTPRGAK